MDDIDFTILNALEENARIPLADLSRKTGLSARAAGERMRKLEEEGVIAGYHASINLAKVGFPIRAIVCVKAPRDQYPRLISRARDIPEVRAAHHANEPTSFVLRVVARDEADLKRVLDSFSEFGPIDCVRILSTPVEKHSA